MFYVIFYSIIAAFIGGILYLSRNNLMKHRDHLVYLLDSVHENLCFLQDNLEKLTPQNVVAHKELLIGFRIEMRACKMRLNELAKEARKETRIRPMVGTYITRYKEVRTTLRSIDHYLRQTKNGAVP